MILHYTLYNFGSSNKDENIQRLLCECYYRAILYASTYWIAKGDGDNHNQLHHAGTDSAYPGGAVDGSPGPPGVGIFRSALLSCSAALFAA